MKITVKASTYEAFLKIKALGLSEEEMKHLTEKIQEKNGDDSGR